MKSIFLIFSATPFKMGKFIRFFTKEKYNHVSLSFDRELNEAYTIGRFHLDTPFYGGINKDSRDRYEYKGKKAQIVICRVPLSEERQELILNICREMYNNKTEYLYNHFSAIGCLIKKKLSVKNSFTCVEFVVELLSRVSDKINAKKYYSVYDLFNIYKDTAIYQGEALFKIKDTDGYRDKHGFFTSSKLTFKMLLTLIGRI